MSNFTYRFYPLLLLFVYLNLPAAASAQSGDQALPDGVQASVNGRPILDVSVDSIARQLAEDGQPTDSAAILDELVKLEILTQAAEALDLDKEPEISATLQLQYTQTMASAYLARKSAEITFSDEQLRAEYDAQAARMQEREFRASHILVESNEQAQQLIAEINAGKSFSTAAREFSIDASSESGGDLGWIVGPAMDPAFADALSSLDIGQISQQPVKTDFGYHIIQLIDKRSTALPDFNSVRAELISLAKRKALADHVDELKAAASITTR